jgi:catalase
VSGDVDRYNSADDDNFTQVNTFWTKVLKPDERQRLAQNIAGHVKNAQDFIQERVIKNFSKAHPQFGKMIQDELTREKKATAMPPHYGVNNGSHYKHSNL